MAAVNNRAESGQADGTTVTAANSGGGGDDAFDSGDPFFIGAPNTTSFTFDSTHVGHGLHAYKWVAAAAAGVSQVGWRRTAVDGGSLPSAARWFGRVYLWGSQNPTNNWAILRWLSGGATGTLCCSIQISTTGKLRVLDSAGTVRATSTNSVPLSALWRIEFDFTFSTTVGQFVVKLFSGDSTTVTETLTGTSNHNFGAATADTVLYINPAGTNIGVRTWWFDDFNVNTVELPGPGAATPTPSLITGTGTVQSPSLPAAAAVAVIAGSGSVQAPAPTDLPTPVVVAGTGSVQSPLLAEIAPPNPVSGTGAVPAPSPTDLPTPAAIAGLGTVQGILEVGSESPTPVAGSGTVQGFVGVARALLGFVAGTGSLPSPTVTTASEATPTPDVIAGAGGVATPAVSVAVLAQPIEGLGSVEVIQPPQDSLVELVTGTGGVPPAVVVVSPRPATLAGSGTVEAILGLMRTDVVAVIGTGTVLTPSVPTLGSPTPEVIDATGAVQSVAVSEILAQPIEGLGSVEVIQPPAASAPDVVNGSGEVQGALAIFETPGAVIGTGTVLTPMGVTVPPAAVIAGFGTVLPLTGAVVVLTSEVIGAGTVEGSGPRPQPNALIGLGEVFTPATDTPRPAPVVATGLVQSSVALVVVKVSPVPGAGTVLTPQLVPISTTVLGLGTVESITGLFAVKPMPIIGVGTVFEPVSVPFLVTVVAMIIQLRTRAQRVSLLARAQVINATARHQSSGAVERRQRLGVAERRQRLGSVPATTIKEQP